MRGVVNQGSAVEIPLPRFLLGAVRVGTLCVARTQIPESQEETGVQHKPHCLHKQFGPLLPGDSRNPPEIQVPKCQPGAKMQVGFL